MSASPALRLSRWHLPLLAALVGATFFFLDRAYARATTELTLRHADAGQELAVAYLAALGPVGVRDGMVFAGNERLDGTRLVVDPVKASTGLGCSLYHVRKRISSSGDDAMPLADDLDEALGAALSGLPFRGAVQARGRSLFVVDHPLRDASGHIIGVIETAIDRDDFERGLLTFRLVLGGALTMLTGLLFLLVLRVEQQEHAVADARAVEAEARARLRGEFFAGMSHELRTPLSAVLGFAASLRGGGEGADVADVAARIEQLSRDLLGIINNILDAAKLESGQVELLVEDVDAAAAVERVVRKCEALTLGRPMRIVTEIAPNLGAVRADFVKLQQVLTNLVGNAVKFTERGEVRVRVFLDGLWMVFEVADTGIGIAPESIDAIWIPFRQADGSIARRFGGSGLGLSIVQALVRLMGGSVVVRSTLGQGSTFVVRLPRGF